ASPCAMNRSLYLLHSHQKETLRFAPCGVNGWRHLRRILRKVARGQKMVRFVPTEEAEIRKSIGLREAQGSWETGHCWYLRRDSIGSRMIPRQPRKSQSFTKFGPISSRLI